MRGSFLGQFLTMPSVENSLSHGISILSANRRNALASCCLPRLTVVQLTEVFECKGQGVWDSTRHNRNRPLKVYGIHSSLQINSLDDLCKVTKSATFHILGRGGNWSFLSRGFQELIKDWTSKWFLVGLGLNQLANIIRHMSTLGNMMSSMCCISPLPTLQAMQTNFLTSLLSLIHHKWGLT